MHHRWLLRKPYYQLLSLRERLFQEQERQHQLKSQKFCRTYLISIVQLMRQKQGSLV